MNYSIVITELLRALRGKRSQVGLSRRLRFRFNQIYRWESGQTKIGWTDFVRLTEVVKVDLGKIIRMLRVFDHHPSEHVKLVESMIGSRKIVQIARDMKCSTSVLSRWLNGRTTPSLEQMLRLMQATDQSVIQFLDAISPIEDSFPSLREKHQALKRRIEFFHCFPDATLVIRLMETDEYRRLTRYERGWFARRLKIPIAEEKTIIETLVRLELVEMCANKPVPIVTEHIRTISTYEQRRKTDKYWQQMGAKVLDISDRPTIFSSFGYWAFSCSEEARKKVREAEHAFYQTVGNIVNTDQPASGRSTVMALYSQLLDLRDLIR